MGITLENKRIARAFRNSLHTYDQEATVQHAMAHGLVMELKAHCPKRFDRVLELGCGTGQLTAKMLSTYQIERYIANDLVPEFEKPIGRILDTHPETKGSFLPGDVEAISCYPDNLSLIVSGATFQWLNDIQGYLARIRNHLLPEGILAFTTFGPENCKEIRALTGLGLAYPTLADLTGGLEGSYQILAARESQETRFFDSPLAVLRHMKATGVNGMAQHRWTPRALQQFCDDYTATYQQGPGIPLTYHPMLIIAKRK